MSETVADLVLDDEHVTIGLEDTLVEGCKRLVSIPSGILVVLDDEDQVKGVIGQRQMLKAIGNGVDVSETTCKEVMEMDVLKVPLTDAIADVIKSVNERMPQAVVAVNEMERLKATSHQRTIVRHNLYFQLILLWEVLIENYSCMSKKSSFLMIA